MKLKKPTPEAAPEEVKPASGGAFIAARHRNPAEEVASQTGGKGELIGGIFAIASTVMLIVISVLLYMNWEAIKSA